MSLAGVRAVGVALCLVLAPSYASADEKGRPACFASSEQGQLDRNAGKLRAARRALMVCAGEPCPAQMRRDCAKWLGEVEATLATVVLTAHDARGDELTDVRVSVDGEPLVERLDGKPVEVDPGDRTFAFESRGRFLERRVVVHAGDRAARLEIVLDVEPLPAAAPPAAAEPPPARRPRPRSPLPLVLAGLALATGTIGGTLAVIGFDHEKMLRRTCAPRCSESDMDILHHQYLAADVFFGLAIVAAGAAAWLLVTGDRGAEPPARGALRITSGLGAAAVGGVF